MKKGLHSFLLFAAVVCLGDCAKQSDAFDHDWTLEIDAATHYVTLGVPDTIHYTVGNDNEDFKKVGGLVQIHPDEENGFEVTGSGDGWITVIVSQPGIHSGRIYRLLNTTKDYKAIKFIVCAHKLIYAKCPVSGTNDIYTCNDDGTNEVDLTNTPGNSEHAPSISSDGTMYGYIDTHKYWIIRNSTDTIFSQTFPTQYPQNLHFVRDETGFTVLGDIVSGVRAFSLDPAGSAIGIPYHYATSTYREWFVNANSILDYETAEMTYIETYSSTYINNNPGTGTDFKLRQTGPNSSTPVLVSNHPSTVSYAEISPDGKYLVYASSNNLSVNHVIYIIDRSDPSTPLPLTVATTDCDHPTFSPNSKEIIFSGDNGTQHDLFRINIDGTDLRNITNTSTFDETEPEWR